MQVKKQQLELDVEQQTGAKSWKEYVKAVYCHPAYLTYLTTERFHFHFSLSCIGEGNGNPLQCFCLENPRDGGA